MYGSTVLFPDPSSSAYITSIIMHVIESDLHWGWFGSGTDARKPLSLHEQHNMSMVCVPCPLHTGEMTDWMTHISKSYRINIS